ADQVPSGVRFIVSVFCAVEIADLGNEGAVYGLVTSVSNLTSPVAAVLYKYVDSFFRVTNEDMLQDSAAVRWDVTYTFIFSYAMKLASLSWLFLLPPQKAHLQRLKRHGTTSPVAGAMIVLAFLILLVFSIVTNLMSIFPSTWCYRLAGGRGATCFQKMAVAARKTN
ncbi:hypothetical protein As57867_008485, partial [Aphanomyces stellatus]